ncbi:MAG TPA: hypothetical protein VJ650_12300 [Gemmatimonadaceae bacterium]|nr:hypothetical protein [Gemmatimonadaceae bacterium]
MDETLPVRFIEDAQDPWGDPRRYLVQCPKCARMATVGVTAMGNPAKWDARVVCIHCGFNQSAEHDGPQWRGPVVLSFDGRCSRCGRELHWRATRRAGGPGHQPVLAVRCPGCRTVNQRPANWSRDSQVPTDGYFGLPLWLQTECCGHVLWALNEGHLLFLERYIGAQLRERAPNRNGSLASRLPTWMKDAKHRDEIMTCLARLRHSLAGG